ncbi:ATP-binding protein [Streptomyces meridianus]|uniref:histidine kinase n=1 Tax=Streptomyces meridianus TaxID=2938945 RepID=A0ABT0XBK8_9ACTN|nr:ATP-binding protein [Streptomyces meridianus]MCM2579909.1 ATP-binding protein [Streptomyces meridianus]
MTRHIPEAAFWCLAAGVLAGLVLLVRERLISRRLRKRLAVSEDSLRARDAEARHLVEVRLPVLEEAEHFGPAPAPGLLDPRLAGTEFGRCLQHVVDRFTGAADKARARADQSAKATLKAAMRALQALANEQQLSITDMQDRHHSPAVLQDLLEIDHANSQFGRRAQAIAVLCGSWPGRQRVASPLIDVVRGAKSRVRDYRRIEIHTRVDIDVVSRAVEPVVLTVAELLDNAARHSQPNTTVEVNIRPAHNGTCIVIDDAGVGMDAREIEEAGRRLSGREDIDINRLGDPPQFGFAVIGVLAARYGFNVSIDSQSPYGGVRAVVLLPSSLLTRAKPQDAAPQQRPIRTARAGTSAPAPLPVRRTVAEPSAAPVEPAVSAEPAPSAAPEATAGGLPKRRRRAAAEGTVDHQGYPDRGSSAPTGTQSVPVRSARETASRMGAFARGTRFGRAAAPSEHEGNHQE